MANLPRLSDLDIAGAGITSGNNIDVNSDIETTRLKNNYNIEMNNTKKDIMYKIDELNSKLSKHQNKEGMLDKIIAQTYTEMENLGPNEFTRRGQKQTVLLKQLEALGMLHDTILKYEDMIQKYFKVLMDIENNKLNSHIKVMNLYKEEKTTDDQIGEVMKELQEMLKSDSNGLSSSPMIDDIKQELERDGY